MVLTGNFGVPGAQYLPTALIALARASGKRAAGCSRERVAGGRRQDHQRAGAVQRGARRDPDRSPAPLPGDARRERQPGALAGRQPSACARRCEALELVVVIDVAMTETARLAHYVLPAPTQFEKWESTFFNFDFPHNVFHLRKPVLAAPDGVLPEPEIHARLVEALGALRPEQLAPLRAAAERGSRRVRRGVLRGHRRRPGARRAGAGRAVPHARPDAARRRGVGGDPVGCGASVRAGLRGIGPARRLHRRGPRARRVAVRRDPDATTAASRSRIDEWDDVWPRVQTDDQTDPTGHPRAARRAGRAARRRRRSRPTSSRSSCRPASAARSPPTRSSATPRGASATPRARCGSARPTPTSLGVVDRRTRPRGHRPRLGRGGRSR